MNIRRLSKWVAALVAIPIAAIAGIELVEYRATEDAINDLATEFSRRQSSGGANPPPLFLFVYGLQRYRVLRKQEESFSFGSGDEGEKKPQPDKQFNDLPKHFGASGRHAQSDILNYIAGINARIDEVNKNPTELPAEYAALGTTPQRWTVSDTAAEAVFLVTQFTVSNGGEEVNSQMQEAFQRRFGKGWRKPYHDLREAQDPEAFTVAKRPFRSDNPGRVRHGLNTMPDYGSIAKRDALVSGPSSSQAAAQRAALPAWARSVEGLRASLPHVESNAVMIPRRLSSDGRALAAMGPQVGYYSPQIFSEYELHGGGIDAEGVTFPGASPWPLIGHGIDFAWSGTSANGDNEDTFVERLCNPNGSRPSRSSTHYRYRGRCIQFRMRDQTVTTPYSVLNPTSPPEKITYRTMRSVHGPVFAFARVHGAPVALSKAKAVDFHELSAALPFMHLAENQATSARSFQRIFSPFQPQSGLLWGPKFDHYAFRTFIQNADRVRGEDASVQRDIGG